MAAEPEVKVKITADADGVVVATTEASESVKKFGKNVRSLAKEEAAAQQVTDSLADSTEKASEANVRLGRSSKGAADGAGKVGEAIQKQKAAADSGAKATEKLAEMHQKMATTARNAGLVLSLFGVAMNGSSRGNPETQLQAILLAHPTVSGLTPTLAEANPELLRLVRKYLDIYKAFIRPFHREARVYHHTPVLPGADGAGWCVLEYASADRRRAVAGVFRLVNADADEYRLRLRGVDPARRYRITIEPGGLTTAADGLALLQQGLTVRLDTPLSSRLLLCEAE